RVHIKPTDTRSSYPGTMSRSSTARPNQSGLWLREGEPTIPAKAGACLRVRETKCVFTKPYLIPFCSIKDMKIVAVLYPAGELARTTPELLGCAENALGLMHLDLEGQGHEFVVLTDKESTLDKHLPTTDVLITTPFWPAYVTAERISKAPKLKLILTAGQDSQLSFGQDSFENTTNSQTQNRLDTIIELLQQTKQGSIIQLNLTIIVFMMGLAYVIFGLYIGQEQKLS